ncbi:hypothetical protein IE53DRAFT_191862 [Violaceomyces palustris]|uniref:Uncharacterized protein n=1 Tax=Violaceomyces palustris TaxID=1673888 RepID=A0ACD0NS15_9BASI|nr:hypothetical protein IE53DRAFT_191862 [Violaceomyces palustris]
MAFRNRSHQPLHSVASVDLDVEGASNSSISESYHQGLPWPLSNQRSISSWSAKGPADYVPTLSILQSAKAHLGWARQGLVDANRWGNAMGLVKSSPEIRVGILKGLGLSGVLVAIIFFFELAFFPKVLYQNSSSSNDPRGRLPSDHSSLSNIIWLYPLIGGSFLLASTWSSDVAQAAYKIRHGHTKGLASISTVAASSFPPGTSRRLVQESYRLILIVNYTILGLLLHKIPHVGPILAFLFMSIIDGYYCFEQYWITRGWSLERRMRFCEERWSYFVAFGLPSTAISYFHPSGLLNLMLFMLIFPLCTVLSMLSNPQPRVSASGSVAFVPGLVDRGYQAFGNDDSAAAGAQAGTSAVNLSRWLPQRLPIFWPTVTLHKMLLRWFPDLKDTSGHLPSASSASALAAARAYERSQFGKGPGGFMGSGMGFSTLRNGNGFMTNGKGASPYGPTAAQGRTAAQLVGGIWNDPNLSATTTRSPWNSPGPGWTGEGASLGPTRGAGAFPPPQTNLANNPLDPYQPSQKISPQSRTMASHPSSTPSTIASAPPPSAPPKSGKKMD